MAARWTDKEDATVRAHYPNLNSLVSLLRGNKRSAIGIYARAQKLGLVRRGKTINTVAENRGLLSAAFKRVRYDPQAKADADSLLAVIAGRAPVTEAILETAQQIIQRRDK
jgi:hypothetical protein